MAFLKKGDLVMVAGFDTAGVVMKDFGKKVRVKVAFPTGVVNVPIVDKADVVAVDLVAIDAAAA